MDGEKVCQQLHKNTASYFEQVLEATPHIATAVRPPTSHHENSQSKTNQTCRTMMEKQERVMFSDGPPHMAEQNQDDQLEPTYSSSVRIRDVALGTCQKRWTIGRCGERRPGIFVHAARHDDDDEEGLQYADWISNSELSSSKYWLQRVFKKYNFELEQYYKLNYNNQKSKRTDAPTTHIWLIGRVSQVNLSSLLSDVVEFRLCILWSLVRSLVGEIMVLFTNPSARAGYDTRSIFKRSLTGLNSEFSFS